MKGVTFGMANAYHNECVRVVQFGFTVHPLERPDPLHSLTWHAAARRAGCGEEPFTMR